MSIQHLQDPTIECPTFDQLLACCVQAESLGELTEAKKNLVIYIDSWLKSCVLEERKAWLQRSLNSMNQRLARMRASIEEDDEDDEDDEDEVLKPAKTKKIIRVQNNPD